MAAQSLNDWALSSRREKTLKLLQVEESELLQKAKESEGYRKKCMEREKGKRLMKKKLRKAVAFFTSIILCMSLLCESVVTAKAQNNDVVKLVPYQTINAILCTAENGEKMTMMGEEFTEGFYTDNSGASMSAQYNLGKKYDTVTFTVGHIDNERGDDRTMTVSVDGEAVKSIRLNLSMQNQTVTINVKDASQVSFYVNGRGSSYYDSAVFGVANIQGELSGDYIEPELGNFMFLSPYQSSNAVICPGDEDKSFKMMGEDFTKGFYTDNAAASMSVQYNLRGKHEEVRFTVGHVDNERGYNRTLTVSLDGEDAGGHQPDQEQTIWGGAQRVQREHAARGDQL